MKKNIHFFSKDEFIKDEEILEKIGIRGRLANDFASLKLPILPGFIIDSDVAAALDDVSLNSILKEYIKKSEKYKKRQFGNPENPMLLKIVISPNLAIVRYPTLHNYGLTENTIPGFNNFVGSNFSFHELLFLIRGSLEIEAKIAELEKRTKDLNIIEKVISEADKEMETGVSENLREKALGKRRNSSGRSSGARASR